jgi:hypothetical protein
VVSCLDTANPMNLNTLSTNLGFILYSASASAAGSDSASGSCSGSIHDNISSSASDCVITSNTSREATGGSHVKWHLEIAVSGLLHGRAPYKLCKSSLEDTFYRT